MEIIANKNFGKNTPEILTLMRSWNPKEICDFHHTLGNKTTPLIQLPHLAKSLGIKNILVKDVAKLCKSIVDDVTINVSNEKVPNKGYGLSNQKLIKSGFEFKVLLSESIKQMIGEWKDG